MPAYSHGVIIWILDKAHAPQAPAVITAPSPTWPHWHFSLQSLPWCSLPLLMEVLSGSVIRFTRISKAGRDKASSGLHFLSFKEATSGMGGYNSGRARA